MLGTLVRSRVVLILGVLDSVTPRIRHDEPLLRILAEREAGQILSLRHPCPDRAISSFIGTWCFEEGHGSFIIRYGKRILIWRIANGFQISEGGKGFCTKVMASCLPSYKKGKTEGIKYIQVSKRI